MGTESKFSEIMQNMHTRREEWVIARTLQAAVVSADSAYCSYPDPSADDLKRELEKQITQDGIMRIACNVAAFASAGQIENAIIILRLAQRCHEGGGIAWLNGHFKVIGEPEDKAERGNDHEGTSNA